MKLSDIKSDNNFNMFENLSADDLSDQINIFIGDNGIGKTELVNKISLYAKKGGVESVVVNSDQLPYSPALVQMAKACLKEPVCRTKLLELLVIAEPQFIDLMVQDEQLMAQVTWDREPITINKLGRGFNQLLKIGLASSTVKEGFVFIDDIESFLHYKTQAALAEFIHDAAINTNSQYFINTHSTDFIKSIVNHKPDESMVGRSIIRLGETAKYSRKGAVVANIFSGEEVRRLMKCGMDIR